MPSYLYGPNAALDVTTGLLLGNTVGKIYAITDVEYTTPLQVSDLNGILGVEVGVYNGITQSFRVEDHASVIWVDSVSLVPVALDAYGGNVPPGGAAGQVLAKVSGTDNDLTWVDPGTGGGGVTLPDGGTSGQVLTKASSTSGDALWMDAPSAGGSGGAIMVWRYTGTAWPALPSTKPAGLSRVDALGPTYPTVLPSWVGLGASQVPLSYSKVSVL